MKIVLIRHMTTKFNVRGVLQGRRDIPILPVQPEDQEKIAANLEKIKAEAGCGYDHVLVSRLKRTQMTAEVYGRKAVAEPLLDELDFGPYEGRIKKEFVAEQPLWIDRPDLLVLGEPLLDFEKRVKAFCVKYHTCDRMLVFGHGAWIRALLSIVRSGSIQTMNQMDVLNNNVMVLQIPKGDF